MGVSDKNTEEVILQAARKVFMEKGLDGASVQDIADEAGVTKSMVNYYFRSKDKLFSAVFLQEFRTLFSGLASFLAADLSIRQKIERVIELDIEKLSQMPTLPIFVMNEINRNPDLVATTLNGLSAKPILALLDAQIAQEVAAGILKPIRAIDLFISVQSLVIFPFLARPVITNVLGLSEEEYQAMLNTRKTLAVEMIWNTIKK